MSRDIVETIPEAEPVPLELPPEMDRKLVRRIERIADVEERVLAHELAETADAMATACRSARNGDWKSAMLVYGLFVRFAVLNARALEQERSRRFTRIRRELARHVVASLKGEPSG